jgi:hypothetical protein
MIWNVSGNFCFVNMHHNTALQLSSQIISTNGDGFDGHVTISSNNSEKWMKDAGRKPTPV